jgi:prohibitin 2
MDLRNFQKGLSKNLRTPPNGLGAGIAILAGGGLLIGSAMASLFNGEFLFFFWTLLIVVFFFCVPVDSGHRAVIFNKITGTKQTVYDEGTHFKIPWMEKAVIFNVRSRPREIASLTGSKGNAFSYDEEFASWKFDWRKKN